MAIEVDDGKPPEWMIALENKQKRLHKLAHDVGAGAPCLNCNDGCAGLDLHFWRKICRNCKCKKEVHDVKEENSHEQFEILFGDNLKSGDRVKQLSLNLKLDDILNNAMEAQQKDVEKISSDDNLIFDWIPTDVPANLASEYLQQLPLEKLPITGSAGAMFRRQQLQKQMPLHDFKISDSNELTEEETKAFTEYVDNLKNNAVGKGQITKIFLENYPDSDSLANDRAKLSAFSTNLNSTPKPFKSSYDNGITDSDSFPPPPPELLYSDGLSLKTPSAFVPYKPSMGISHPNESRTNTESIPYIKENSTYNQHKENSSSVNGVAAQYAQMNIDNKSAAPYSVENTNYAKQRENSVPLNQIADQYTQTIGSDGALLDALNYNRQKLNSIPVGGVAAQYSHINMKNKSSLPYSVGENMNYAKQIEDSVPLNRVPAQYSKTIENDDPNALDTKNNNWYRNNDLDETTVSLKPSDIIRKLNARPISPAVNEAIKTTPVNKNIPALYDSTVKNIDGKFLKIGTPEQFQALSTYVPRSPQVSNTLGNPEAKHYNLNDPAKSSEVYFDPLTVSVHPNGVCNAIDPYQQVEEMKNFKLQQCHHCKLPAYPGQVVVVAERAGIEVIWHPQCFVCITCQEMLVDLVYFFHQGEVYCGRHYAEELKIPRCFACDELIFVREYTVAEGQSFHVQHFCCFECDIPLGGMQYVPKDGNPVCLPCYEIKYGKKCHYCDKMIKIGDSRVGWKELSWHAIPDCFKCIQCSKSLLGGKFVVKDEKPLCSKECAMKLTIP